MMKLFKVFVLTLLLQVTFQKLQTNNRFGPPNLTDYEYADNDHRINGYHQAIISSYKFDGCGSITLWGVDVFYDDQNSYTLDFQVWRPSPTVENSTGTGLVGNNRFTSISLTNDLAIVTPSPQDYVEYQPGDVVGFYVENAARNHNGIVLRTSPSWLISELVWFASITGTATTSLNGDCPYSVGSDGVLDKLTRAAPVISIAIASSSCYSSKVNTTATTNTVDIQQPMLTRITAMPTVSHVWSTALVTSTSGLASETRNINNYTERSTLLSGTGHRPDLPQKGTQTIKPEWVVTFGAMIAFLVVIITVLMLVVIKLAKTNEQTTELSGETNYYENIQTYGVHSHDQPATDVITNTNYQLENVYDYPAMLPHWRESVEVVENEVYNYATITNA